MSQALPPLSALRAFEAAGRLLSFARAAEELHVTPAAVSHQIRGLEEWLGTRLFTRTTRRVALTEEGRLALAHFREGFERLARGVEALRRRDARRILTVSTAPSFAAKWLVPRLDGFVRAHARIDLRLAATTALARFDRDRVDLAVRFGKGRYEGAHSTRLFGEFVTPMAHPSVWAALGRKPLPADLSRMPVLHDDSVRMAGLQPGWAEWTRLAGAGDIDLSRGMHFDDGHLVLQAAAEGRGVALGRVALAAPELDAGSLIAPFPQVMPLDAAYWLVIPDGRGEQGEIAAFRRWIQGEARAFARRLPAPGRRPRPAGAPGSVVISGPRKRRILQRFDDRK